MQHSNINYWKFLNMGLSDDIFWYNIEQPHLKVLYLLQYIPLALGIQTIGSRIHLSFVSSDISGISTKKNKEKKTLYLTP